MCTYIHIYIYIYVCICICICMCIKARPVNFPPPGACKRNATGFNGSLTKDVMNRVRTDAPTFQSSAKLLNAF